MRIPLDRNISVPLYRQIEQFLREQLQSGALGPNTRLPSSRSLATGLGVSRIVVANAYAELESHGLVYSQRGSGTFVAPPLAVPPEPKGDFISAQDWPLWQQELLSHPYQPAYQELARLLDSVPHPDPISFAERITPSELWPIDDFGRALKAVFRRDGAAAVGSGDSEAGYLPLRVAVAQILNSEGIPTRPEDVLITSGSQQALNLVAREILSPYDVVLVESPTYNVALDLFRSLRVRLLGVPVDEHGMQVEKVEDALRTARPRLIFTIPTFHNPTGTCMSGYRRRQLVALADRYNVPILEDDFIGNLRYDGRAEPALKALDPGGRVIYVGTFSKVLMPGLRLGFMVAEGPIYKRMLACKYVSDLTTSHLLQRALSEYITVGRYHAHLRRVCKVYRSRYEAMLEALDRHLPAGTQWLPPKGGRYIWLQLTGGLSANELFPIAAKEGVTFCPGSFFFPGKRPQSHLRLNFAINPPDVIEEGVKRLSRALRLLRLEKGKQVGFLHKGVAGIPSNYS